MEEGALDDVDAAISLHTRALPAGSIGVTSGPALAANDTITITVRGQAAHGARPHEGIDALAIAAQVIVAINHIISRRIPAIEPGVISLTTINGGIKENILADLVTLSGTVRSTGGAARDTIFREIERALDVGRALGATCTLHVKEGYPQLRNDARVTDAVRAAAVEAIGAEQVVELPYPRGRRISPTSQSACPLRCSGLVSRVQERKTRSGTARRSSSTKTLSRLARPCLLLRCCGACRAQKIKAEKQKSRTRRPFLPPAPSSPPRGRGGSLDLRRA